MMNKSNMTSSKLNKKFEFKKETIANKINVSLIKTILVMNKLIYLILKLAH